ncbi:translocation/assembly module TamB domain-containing protein [Bartonella sp. HY406]|uniref:translocation/assembly module TamB domain-containing protein n=1 Tax=Bartonella sp. HY406 TaxID=2979331 RepID=UPI0021CA1A42|nr:translocation/assembly module TamB domain-containing protein [Bartonella sp. HY406]UXN04825.1 translocation/assembly module TamB domain-containing protein [Bartonella sp. HY406]
MKQANYTYFKLARMIAIFVMSIFVMSMSSLGNAIAQNATDGQNTTDSQKADEDKSWFLTFVEQQLSTPNRKIVISDISGALSSTASIGSITIADRQGVWLKISKAELDWNRLALLRGRISVNSLKAQKIDVYRKPLPDTTPAIPDPEAKGFSLPELPVSVEVGALTANELMLGQDLFGLQATVSLDGSVNLAGGELSSKFAIKRLDGQGGFTLIADYSNKTGGVKIDLDLNEPQNGIAANLLNIEGRPALIMSVKGDGTIDDLDVKISMDAAGQSVVNGNVSLKKDEKGRNIGVKLNGPIAILMPQQYRPFFGSETALAVDASTLDAGGFILHSMTIDGKAIKVAATAQTASDGFLRHLNVNAQLAAENGGALVLPVSGGQTTIQNMAFNIDYGSPNTDNWSGKLVINKLATTGFTAGDVTINLGGLAQNLDMPASRHVTVLAQGGLNHIGLSSSDASNALGDKIALDVNLDIKPQTPIIINKFDVSANGFLLFLKGEVDRLVFRGDIGLKAQSLAPFSGLAGRNLAGSSDLTMSGNIELATGAANIILNGKASGIKTGVEIADRILASEVILSGGIGRDSYGLHARELKIANKDVSISANGDLGSSSALMDFGISLSNLQLINPQIKGGVDVRAALRGHNSFLTIGATTTIKNAVLQGRKLENFNLAFNGILDSTSQLKSNFSGFSFANGRFDNQPLALDAAFQQAPQGFALDSLNVTLGKTSLNGSLIHNLNGLIDGKFHLDSPDIGPLVALGLMNGKGQALADISLNGENGKQNASLIANAKNIDVAGNKLGNLDAKVHVIDLFGVPQAEGSLNGTKIIAGSVKINEVNFVSTVENGASHFSTTAKLENNTNIDVGGALKPLDNDGWQLTLGQAQVRQNAMDVKLLQPATISLAGSGAITIDQLLLAVAGGKIAVSGTVHDTINMAVDINALPLSVANMVMPELAARGVINGKAQISGPKAKPNVVFSLKGDDLTAEPAIKYGLPALTLTADGNMNGDVLSIATRIFGGGLDVGAKGNIDIAKQGLDVDVTLTQLPIALANSIVKGQNLAGQVVGNAHIGGTFKNPQANFNAQATGISTTVLKDNGLAPIGVKLQGSFDNNIATIGALEVNGPSNLKINASGTVPVSGNGLDLKINGNAPLALANRFLAKRGAQLSGALNVHATVAGSFTKPELGGGFEVANGQFLDPETNARFTQIALSGNLSGETVTISNISARSASGGGMSGGGTISINVAQGMPADITINLNHLRYNDNNMVVVTVNGHVTAKGPLMSDVEIGGDVLIEKAEIRVPDSFGGAAQIDVQHKHMTKPIETTLERAGIETKPQTKTEKAANARVNGPKLNLMIRAPNQIFVRGRGLDTELGGTLRLVGPVSDIRPVGGFNMIRGRLEILTQRLTFEEGQVTMSGNFNPDINFVANTQSDDTTVTVTVKGTPSDLDISFTSQPELPQDEVLARLIFNRSISELSPFQIAQLAAAAAELAGLTNNSLMGSLRSATGLDDLDVVTDAKGNTGVRAGRYIRDNIYLGVEAGSGGDTKGTINLDITKNLKAKGAVGSDANSSVGVFYEKDY